MSDAKAPDILILVVLCAVGFGLGKWQSTIRSRGEMDIPYRIFSPITVGPSQAARQGLNHLSDVAYGITRSAELRAENERLKQLNQSAQIYNEIVSELESRINSLRKLNGLPALNNRKRIVADVINVDARSHRIQLSAGSAAGVEPGMAVINGDGLVGRIESVGPSRSFAILITSPTLRIGAMVMTNPPVAGIIRGTASDVMTLSNAENSSHVKIGDQVTTSTFSETLPPYVPIGRILSRTSQPELGTQEFAVQTNIKLGRLREVMIVR